MQSASLNVSNRAATTLRLRCCSRAGKGALAQWLQSIAHEEYRMVKRWVVLAVVAISLLISTAPVSAFQAGAGPLERMLAQVPDNGTLSRAGLWYGSLGDLQRVLGFQVKSYADFQKLQQQQQAAYLLDV